MKSIASIALISAMAQFLFAQNFGINIANPGATLTIKRDGTDPGIYDDGKTVFGTGGYGSGQVYDGGIEFRHDNLTQGIGFGYNTIYQTGTNANQDLNLIAKGNSPLTLNAYGGASGNVGIGITGPTQKLDVNGNIRMLGNTFVANSSSSSYGATTFQGETNGWGGISFRRAGGGFLGTLMVHEDHQGFYNNADNGWDWYWTNGTLSQGNVPIQRISINGGGGYVHLGTWSGPWNAADGVLVNGALFWHGASPSDRSLKKNIVPISDSELKALSKKLTSIPLYHYQLIDDPVSKELIHIGVMADEVPEEMQLPEKHSINAMNGIMMSVAAIKVLQKENEEMKAQVAELKTLMQKSGIITGGQK